MSSSKKLWPRPSIACSDNISVSSSIASHSFSTGGIDCNYGRSRRVNISGHSRSSNTDDASAASNGHSITSHYSTGAIGTSNHRNRRWSASEREEGHNRLLQSLGVYPRNYDFDSDSSEGDFEDLVSIKSCATSHISSTNSQSGSTNNGPNVSGSSNESRAVERCSTSNEACSRVK